MQSAFSINQQKEIIDISDKASPQWLQKRSASHLTISQAVLL